MRSSPCRSHHSKASGLAEENPANPCLGDGSRVKGALVLSSKGAQGIVPTSPKLQAVPSAETVCHYSLFSIAGIYSSSSGNTRWMSYRKSSLVKPILHLMQRRQAPKHQLQNPPNDRRGNHTGLLYLLIMIV